MAQYRLIPQNITLAFADDAASLDTAPDFTCQVTTCHADPILNYNTTPKTACTGDVQQLVVPVSWKLTVGWLQDWSAPGGGLANYANVNAGQIKFFSYAPTGDPLLAVSGQVEIAPVGFGGDMGVVSIAGPVDWNCQGQPTFDVPAAVPLATAAAGE